MQCNKNNDVEVTVLQERMNEWEWMNERMPLHRVVYTSEWDDDESI